MSALAKARGFWRTSRPLRRRFGLIDGLRVANQLADASHRKRHLPYVRVDVPEWRDPLWLRPGTSDVEVFQQVVVGRELDLDLPSAPRRIIDGGANIGIASRVFAQQWPAAQIAAVEFESRNFGALVKNCEQLPQVQVRCAALWNARGSVGVDAADSSEMGYRADATAAGPRVPALAMEDLLDELGWDTVDLVKLDIEGAERQVLETAPRWLDRIGHLAIELHDRFAPGCTAAFESAVDPQQWSVRPHGEYLVASRIATSASR